MAFLIKNPVPNTVARSVNQPYPVIDQYIRVDRATADVQTGSAVALFSVDGGYILLKALVGEVTTVLAAGTTPDAKFVFNPDTGTTIDLCATASVASDEVGTLYSITGLRTDALQEGSSGAVRTMSHPVLIGPSGDIEFSVDEDITGSIKFSVWYLPLDADARVTVL